MKCIMCNEGIKVGMDAYTVLCNPCVGASVTEADNRATRIENGDLTVTDLTDKERASILARRADDRMAGRRGSS